MLSRTRLYELHANSKAGLNPSKLATGISSNPCRNSEAITIATSQISQLRGRVPCRCLFWNYRKSTFQWFPSTSKFTPTRERTFTNQSFDETSTSNPIDVLQKTDVTDLDSSTAKNLCLFFANSPALLLGPKQSEEIWHRLEGFLVDVAIRFGYEGVAQWGIKTLKAGHGDRVIRVWDRISNFKMQREGRKSVIPGKKDNRGSRTEGMNQRRQGRKSSSSIPWRTTLDHNIHASLLFTATIWSYGSLSLNSHQEPFSDTLSRLLYQTWIPPLSLVTLSPFITNQATFAFGGESKVQKLLNDTFPSNPNLQNRVRRFTSQVQLTQIGWPDLEGWTNRVVKRLSKLLDEYSSPEEWMNLFDCYLDACGMVPGNNRDCQWILDTLKPSFRNTEKYPVTKTIFGYLPWSGRFPVLIGQAFKVSAYHSTSDSMVNDLTLQQIFHYAKPIKSKQSHNAFWNEGFQGAAEAGNVKLFEEICREMNANDVQGDDLSNALHIVAILNSSSAESSRSLGVDLALNKLDQLMSKEFLRFWSLTTKGFKTYNSQERSRLASNIATFQRVLISALLDRNQLNPSIEFLTRLREQFGITPLLHIYNIIFLHLANCDYLNINQRGTKTLELFRQMKSFEVNIDSHICSSIFRSCAASSIVDVDEKLMSLPDEVMNHMDEVGISRNPAFWATVFDPLTSEGDPTKVLGAENLIRRIPRAELDSSLWSMVIAGHFRGCGAEAGAGDLNHQTVLVKKAMELKSIAVEECGIRFSPSDFRIIIITLIKFKHLMWAEKAMTFFREFWEIHPIYFFRKTSERSSSPDEEEERSAQAFMAYLLTTFANEGRKDFAEEVFKLMNRMPGHNTGGQGDDDTNNLRKGILATRNILSKFSELS